MAIGQSNLLQALGWAVFNSLWQMAILWVAYQLIITVFRINRSSQRSALAVSLLFIGFAWFTFTLAAAFATSEAGSSYSGLLNIDGNTELNNWFNTLLPVASILYLLLLVLPVLNFIRNYRYVQVIRRYGLSRASVEWRLFVQQISARMGIRKPVYVWMSELVSSPVTIGYLKPVILLPLAAVSHLNAKQVEAVLLHELSHIRRYDYFINLLTRLIQTVLYFNPFVKAFVKIIEREREKSCDETVIQFQYEPHGYATALLVLEKAAHVPRHSLAVAASDGKKSEFRQRIEWIMGVRSKPAFSLYKLAGVMAALLCFIALNAFLIMSKPVKTALANDAFAFLPSSYEFFADKNGYDKSRNGDIITEHPASSLATTAPEAAPETINDTHTDTEEDSEENIAEESTREMEIMPKIDIRDQVGSAFQYVYNLQNIIPQLTQDQEKQIEQALTESKKVMEEAQWKQVETSIADALTRIEKDKIKEQYKKAMENIPWDKMGDQLRIAYDKIDWTKINSELTTALAAIRMDSLQQVYTIALDQLSHLQKDLIKVDQPGIPDTDITVKSLEEKKKEMQAAIDMIRLLKHPKKLVQL